MKYTFIDGAFNANTGISTVIIGTDLGIFKGTARLHEEDEPHISEYFGCSIAESKAVEKYCNAKYKYYDAQMRALEIFYRQMQDTRTYNEKDFYVKQLKHQIKYLQNKRDFWKVKGNYMERMRIDSMKNRDIALKELKEKLKKKHEKES